MVEFGEQLRRAREEKGMTQQSLAELYRIYDMALFL
jgi:cytoskeletal protein RodZ